MASGLKLLLTQSDKGSWYFYMEGPSGETICFGPYRKEQEEARRDAVAFLYNINHPLVAINLIDKRIIAHPTVSNPQEDYIRNLRARSEELANKIPEQEEEIEEEDPMEDIHNDNPIRTPRKTGHLSIVRGES